MALPKTLDPSSPADLDSPSQGASQIRGIKNYLIDVFGAPNNSAVSAAPMSFTTAGVMSILQSPLTVPSLLQGGASQVLRIESQYSNLVFGISGASVMSLNATGMLMQTGFKEWPSGITGFLGTQGSNPLTLRTNAANRLTIAAGGNVGIGTAVPTALLHVAGTMYSSTVDMSTLSVQNAGPHAIGGAIQSNVQLGIRGNFAEQWGVLFDNTLNPTAGASSGVMSLTSTTVNKAGSGTHADFATLFVGAPTIGAGAAALTNASTVKITTAPSGASNNYALWVAAGNIRTAGNIGSTADTLTGPSLAFNDSTLLILRGGTTGYQFLNQANTTERMRLTDAGILLIGTTVTTSAGAGDLVLPNATGELRGVNAAGTDTLNLISLNASNQLVTRLWTWPTADGSNTQILQTNGSGALSFVAKPAAGSFTSEFISSAQTVTLGSALSVAHGLGAVPKLVQLTLRNVTGEGGYSTDDELVISGVLSEQNASNSGVNVAFDATNVVVMTDAAGFTCKRKDTGGNFAITAGNWKFIVRAWK